MQAAGRAHSKVLTGRQPRFGHAVQESGNETARAAVPAAFLDLQSSSDYQGCKCLL